MNKLDYLTQAKAAWLTNHPDLKLEKLELLARLAQTAATLSRKRNILLRDYSLEAWSYDMLAMLYRANECTPTELAGQAGVTSGTMTHRLRLLEQQGLIKRETSAADKRSATVSLTNAGRERIMAALQAHIAHAETFLRGVSLEDIDVAKRVIALLQERLES